MKLLIVDAFTDKPFGGNPAGVVILNEGKDFPDKELMVKTAAELRYSETAFVKKLSEKEFKIRYFTPADEVDLCGHATIASFVSLLHLGIIKDNETYINRTLAGDLNIKVSDGFIMMDMAKPVKVSEISGLGEIGELYNIMGIGYDEKIGMIPQMISTGLPDIMMPVESRELLDKINPDFKALSRLSEKYNVVGVHAFTLDAKKGVTAHARNFAPLYDIDEEAATGTSNGALTYYLYLNGKIKENDSCKIIQGEKMDRPSVILTEVSKNGDDCLIKVGGGGVILTEGEFNL